MKNWSMTAAASEQSRTCAGKARIARWTRRFPLWSGWPTDLWAQVQRNNAAAVRSRAYDVRFDLSAKKVYIAQDAAESCPDHIPAALDDFCVFAKPVEDEDAARLCAYYNGK